LALCVVVALLCCVVLEWKLVNGCRIMCWLEAIDRTAQGEDWVWQLLVLL
jgi:hypothetical protein